MPARRSPPSLEVRLADRRTAKNGNRILRERRRGVEPDGDAVPLAPAEIGLGSTGEARPRLAVTRFGRREPAGLALLARDREQEPWVVADRAHRQGVEPDRGSAGEPFAVAAREAAEVVPRLGTAECAYRVRDSTVLLEEEARVPEPLPGICVAQLLDEDRLRAAAGASRGSGTSRPEAPA